MEIENDWTNILDKYEHLSGCLGIYGQEWGGQKMS